MSVYIPCLNVDKPDGGGGFSVGVGVGQGGGEAGGLAPGITFTHSDSPVQLGIMPVPPFIFFGPNWQFWFDLFGLGETRIEREKEAIQDVMTPIFKYLKKSYGVPIRDNHALQFPSDGVRNQFERRPDIAALAPYLAQTDDMVASLVFARKNPSQGQEERVSNQFLANAAINNWPVNATIDIWDGIVQAANPNCASVPDRWKYNPEVTQRAAELAVILQYIPLAALVNMATHNAIGNSVAKNLIMMWGSNPQLVDDIPQRQAYDWQLRYQNVDGPGAPYYWLYPEPFNLLDRQHIQALTQTVIVPRPHYPDFVLPDFAPPPPVFEIPPFVPPPGWTPPPFPQPQPLPPRQPRQQDIDYLNGVVNHVLAGRQITYLQDQWLRSPVGQETLIWFAPNNFVPLRVQAYLPGGEQPPSVPAPQPGDPPAPQEPTPPPAPQPPQPPGGGQTGEIPNQQELDRACEIIRRLTRREGLSQADYDWMLTQLGAKALAQMSHDPRCTARQQDGETPIPQPQDPECPDPQSPFPSPQPQPFPFPQPPGYPFPQPFPQPPQQGCPPECLELIELLRQRMEECCELTRLVVLPRIDWLTQWIIDIERRLPGPMPPLPPTPPRPPSLPQPPAIPPELDDPPPIPPGEIPPFLPPEIVACLTTLCDQEAFCQMVQACERELECLPLEACNLGLKIWGVMAECWLQARTPPAGDIRGVYADWSGPAQMLEGLRQASPVHSMGQQSAQKGPRPFGWQGDWGGATGIYATATQHASAVALAWGNGEDVTVGLPHTYTQGNHEYVFASPGEQAVNALKLRSVKLREDEPDPCMPEVV